MAKKKIDESNQKEVKEIILRYLTMLDDDEELSNLPHVKKMRRVYDYLIYSCGYSASTFMFELVNSTFWARKIALSFEPEQGHRIWIGSYMHSFNYIGYTAKYVRVVLGNGYGAVIGYDWHSVPPDVMDLFYDRVEFRTDEVIFYCNDMPDPSLLIL